MLVVGWMGREKRGHGVRKVAGSDIDCGFEHAGYGKVGKGDWLY